VHDTAVKAAEIDATKRALVTFSRPFGLELYRSDKERILGSATAAPGVAAPCSSLAPDPSPSTLPNLNGGQVRSGFHPDDTTSIPRPSRYYGRRQGPTINDHFRNEFRQLASQSAAPPLAPATPDPVISAGDARARIEKSTLALSEPKRLRDKNHLKFAASQPCLICGRQPCDPHHLRFTQPRAIGMKVSDEFTVPLRRGHHRQLHQAGNEIAWWKNLNIDALKVARGLWEQTHPQASAAGQQPTNLAGNGNRPDHQLALEDNTNVDS
jgi:Rad52/22 family double-strand break repair protein